jgi:phospholipase C
MPDLDDIKTIVIVKMENRSFDHIHGYLSLPPHNWQDVEDQLTDLDRIARFIDKDGSQLARPVPPCHPYYLPDGFDAPH